MISLYNKVTFLNVLVHTAIQFGCVLNRELLSFHECGGGEVVEGIAADKAGIEPVLLEVEGEADHLGADVAVN